MRKLPATPSVSSKPTTIVVGQGLAGTAVAWELHRRGHDFVIIDPGSQQAASHVAAGLITPVAGKRFAVAPHFDELYQRASDFYADIEKRLGTVFFQRQPALRLCYENEEIELFDKRAEALVAAGEIRMCSVTELGKFKSAPLGFVMPRAARLLTGDYLNRSRQYFASKKRLVTAHCDPEKVEASSHGITIPSLGLAARRIVFCGGHVDELNPWLPQGVFNSAKGEVLTVRLNGLDVDQTVHAYKSWLCPLEDAFVYSFGATYEHDDYEPGITQRALEQLTQRLSCFVHQPISVLAQHFGVRPIGLQRKAIMGRHPDHSNIAWVNGLGSKGSLLAPYLAFELVTALDNEQPVSSALTPALLSG